MPCLQLTNAQVDALEVLATSNLERAGNGPWRVRNQPLGPMVRNDTLRALDHRGLCKILPSGIATLTHAGQRELAAIQAVRMRLSMA